MGGLPLPSRPNVPPLLLVDGHNLLWGATFGFPAEVRSRDKTRLLTRLSLSMRLRVPMLVGPGGFLRWWVGLGGSAKIGRR